MQNHTERSTYNCEVCSKEFYSENGFKNHMQGHENVLSPCSICQKSFQGNENLKRHVNNQHSAPSLWNKSKMSIIHIVVFFVRNKCFYSKVDISSVNDSNELFSCGFSMTFGMKVDFCKYDKLKG